MLLGLNIDHVATLREARYRDRRTSNLAEPSLLEAAKAAISGGADSLTIHTREDRRHLQPEDAFLLKQTLPTTPLNLELGLNKEMLDFAVELQPSYACLVPEGRDEVTTEGGLNVAKFPQAVTTAVKSLQKVGTQVSLFIEPEIEQIHAAKKSGATMVELHTGAYANAAETGTAQEELQRLIFAAKAAHEADLQVNAGHGIRLDNLPPLAQVPYLSELNIGHSTISRALFIGLENAVKELRDAIDQLPWTNPILPSSVPPNAN